MQYYNQNDYSHVPYPSPQIAAATVKSGGCGVCCGSTMLSFFGQSYPPEVLAPIFIAEGARASGGTDMGKAAQIICRLGHCRFSTANAKSELLAHLAGGGTAIANVGGNREGYTGIFSNGGHYICVLGVIGGTLLSLYDVGDYSTKYSKPPRSQRVARDGILLRAEAEVLAQDAANRNPRYYLFSKEEAKMDTKPTWQEELGSAAWWVQQTGISDGTRPKEAVTREELWVMLNRFAQYMKK